MAQLTETISLSKVKTIEDFKNAIGESQLVMYTKFGHYNELDARKANTTWPKIYVVKLDSSGNLVYYSTVSAELNYLSDITNCMSEHFQRAFDSWTNKDSQHLIFELFVYNRKKKNTMYLCNHFIPDEVRLTAIETMRRAKSLLDQALVIGRGGSDMTDKHRGIYKAVPKTAVVERSGDYNGITYVVGGQRYIFNFNYAERYSIEKASEYYNINGWARASRTFNRSNSDYTFKKIPQKEVNEMHSLLLQAKEAQDEFQKIIHDWHRQSEWICK